MTRQGPFGFFRGRRALDGLDEEIRDHIERETEENIGRGMSPEEARRLALIKFGNAALVGEDTRRVWVSAWLDEARQDIRYTLRTLRRNPAFTAAAAATLALAIGATTAMFSVVNAVLLRPLPYESPEQVVMLSIGTPGGNPQRRPAFLTVEDWRRHSKSFTDIAIFDPLSATLTDRDGAERIAVGRISPNFFPLLGVHPVLGRSFSGEEAAERRRLAVISHAFWQARFGGSPGAIGASLVVDGLPSEIVGILPASPQGPTFDADVWEPHTLFPDWEARRSSRGAGSWFVLARLQPHVTVDQAQSEMDTIARVLDRDAPAATRNMGIAVVPLSMHVVGPRSRLALWMLAGAVLCVLAIAAANVAGLSLARSVERSREFGIRAAIGATPARLTRQLLAESVTLGAMSGLLGTVLAGGAVRLIRAFGPAGLARLNEASLDFRVLTWALAISLLTGVFVGLAPMLPIVRRDARLSGEEEGRSVAGGSARRGARRVLVVAEFALAMVLLASAGLLVQSWLSAQRVDPGFRPERVLSVQLSTTGFGTAAERATFYSSVLEQVASVPGVESADIVSDFFISSDADSVVTTEGNAVSERVRLRRDEASDGLFTTVGAPLIAGRFFSVTDGPDAPRVAIINQTMARRLWGGLDASGRRFKLGPRDVERPWITVVGVVGDMRRQGLETEPMPQMFVPLAQDPSRLATLLVRTSEDDPLPTAASVRTAVRRVDKHVPLYRVTTLEDQLGAYLRQRRFETSLLVGFSLVALLMAAVGIYGLIHYSVAMRRREIALRMALGATAHSIFRMIVREGLQLSVAGLLLGLVGALLVARAASRLLYGVTPSDPLTFAAVSLLLTAVAGAACYLPARRATKVDPIVALRHA